MKRSRGLFRRVHFSQYLHRLPKWTMPTILIISVSEILRKCIRTKLFELRPVNKTTCHTRVSGVLTDRRYGSEMDRIKSYVRTGEQPSGWLYRQDVAQRATIRTQTARSASKPTLGLPSIVATYLRLAIRCCHGHVLTMT
jgi:hypothetical protein